MKSLKNCLFTFGAFFGFLLTAYIIFAYFALDVHRDVVFSLNNWQNSIEKDKSVKLDLIKEEYLDTLNMGLTISRQYYLVNFKNSLEDYKIIEKEIRSIFKDSSKNKDGLVIQRIYFNFYWNTYSDIARHIKNKDSFNFNRYLDLFSIEVSSFERDIYYILFIPWKNLNIKDNKYAFKVRDFNTIETDHDSFNFIFWYQAREFIAKKIPDLKNRRVAFYNKDKKIIEFEFNNLGDRYKLNF